MRALCGGLAIAMAIGVGGCVADDDTPATSTVDGVVATHDPHRPVSVPDEYVATPNGYFHPDCIHEVGDDENVRADGWIEKLDHSAVRRIDLCAHPRYDWTGRAIALDAGLAAAAAPNTEPATDNYRERASTTKLGPIKYIHAQWNIPAAPATKSSQTVYFFPSLEHTGSDPVSILQPVLAWNQGGSGISGWSLASWNCCVGTGTYHSNFIAAPGSTVSGDVGGAGCNSAGVCSSWQIVSYDFSSEKSTTFNTTAYGNTLTYIFGGALEAPNVTECSEYPGGTVTFTDFYIDKSPSGDHVATPAWTTEYPNPSPSCSYDVTYNSSHDVTLHY